MAKNRTLEYDLPTTVEAVAEGTVKHPAHIVGPSRLPYGLRARVRSAGLPDQVQDGAGEPMTDFPSMQVTLLREWLSNDLTRWAHWYTEDGEEMEKDWSVIEVEANEDDLDYLGARLLFEFFPQMFRTSPALALEEQTTEPEAKAKTTTTGNGKAETHLEETSEISDSEQPSRPTPIRSRATPSEKKDSSSQTKSSSATSAV